MSSRTRLVAVAACLLSGLSLVAAGCGGDDAEVPEGAVAVVGDASIPAAELDRAMARFRAAAEAQNQTFPEESTDAFDQARQQALDSLVLQRVVNFEARDCGTPCNVTDKDIKAEFDRIVESDFSGSQKRFDDFLKESKYTLPDARQFLRFQLQQPKLFNQITRGIRFTDADARKYYDENRDQFRTAAGRTARHILVETEADAKAIRAEVTPANFADIARDRSIDESSAPMGGSLGGPLQRGSFVPEFETAAFALGDGEISEPVKTQYGWHVIYVDVTPATTTSFADAQANIKAQQLNQRRQDEFTKWRDDVIEKWRARTDYAEKALEPRDPDAPVTDPAGGTSTVPGAETTGTEPAP